MAMAKPQLESPEEFSTVYHKALLTVHEPWTTAQSKYPPPEEKVRTARKRKEREPLPIRGSPFLFLTS